MIRKLVSVFLLLTGSFAFSQGLKNTGDPVFKVGEKLQYRLRYGFITAAEASIRVEETTAVFDNKPVYHLIAEGGTAGTFSVFYKVKNRYDSYIDQLTMSPYLYKENIREANYRRSDQARFYQDEKKVVSKKGTFKSNGQLFDVVSAYYFARNLNISQLSERDKFSPSIQPGRIFRKNSKLYLWITDDANRIPVKAQVELLVGSVTLELMSAEGMKYAL